MRSSPNRLTAPFEVSHPGPAVECTRSDTAPLVLLLVACATARPPRRPRTTRRHRSRRRAAADRHPSRGHLRAHSFLADDLLEGRGTGDRGHRIAAAYVASQLAGPGAGAGGDGGGWFQADHPPRRTDAGAALLEVGTTGGSNLSFVQGTDFLAHPPAGHRRGRRHRPGGLRRPRHRRSGVPAGTTWPGSTSGGRWPWSSSARRWAPRPTSFLPFPARCTAQIRTKLELLQSRGAVGVLMVHTPEREKVQPWARAVATADMESMALVEDGRVAASRSCPASALHARRPTRCSPPPAAPSGWPTWSPRSTARKSRSFELGTRARIRIEATLRTVTSVNVAGLWRAASGSPAGRGDGGLQRPPRSPRHRQAGERRRHLQRRLGRRRRGGAACSRSPRAFTRLPAAAEAQRALPVGHRRGEGAARLGVVRRPPHRARGVAGGRRQRRQRRWQSILHGRC